MRYFLSAASHAVASNLAAHRTLCAFDFDGTLAPIVDRPERARMRARTRLLLGKLTKVYPCVVISGRARSDVRQKLSGSGVKNVLGNHGAESEKTDPRRSETRGWRGALQAALAGLDGVWIEDKGLSLAVHYRNAPDKKQALRKIEAAAQGLDCVRLIGGKLVVNLTAFGAPNKGTALAAERDRLGCDWILYVGDDENDEDAFSLAGNVVPVRIGRKQRSNARYYLRDQEEIDGLLARMALLRSNGRV